ncbi:MAG: hypothetical protein V5B40_04495 [Candidatus Accumulibacter meliphilus]|jgi:hypothetical protein|uniref:Uncharacterized protein n=1 Tax=Candidatus Accumulibacter meliphilus TaxID=2211374 RepID=A0A369XMJ5_9PROT|nr:MAG: hypothetical protein DVS81_09885 [Candidatus Accumulibacter meliphilus]
MNLQTFDLNDITREPSDEQLDALMEAVATEARRQSQVAREQLLIRLRAEISAIERYSGKSA